MPTHHTIDYIEFTVRDLAAAKRFYIASIGTVTPSGWVVSTAPSVNGARRKNA